MQVFIISTIMMCKKIERIFSSRERLSCWYTEGERDLFTSAFHFVVFVFYAIYKNYLSKN